MGRRDPADDVDDPDLVVAEEIERLLERHGPSELARRAGVTARAIEYWAAGRSKPKPEALARLRASFVGGERRAPEAVVQTQDSKTVALDTVDRLRRALVRLEDDPEATSRELASVATSLTSANRLLARLTGSLEVNESQVVRSPAFRRVVAVMLDVLRAELHDRPDIAKKLTDAVERLDTEGR